MNNNKGTTDTNFTSLTFDEIKEKLLQRAKTYYPDTYKDFNASSFGSLMFDMVAMMSEQLSFYSNYVANESFLQTSRQFSSLEKRGKENGVQINNAITSTGIVKFYTAIPADSTLGTIDTTYSHRILKGAVVSTNSGGRFTTTEDVVVDLSTDNIIGTTFSNDASRITYYVYESEASVISGEEKTVSVNIGTYQKFLKVEVKDFTVSEVLKVEDLNGNEYYEVANLSQNVVYLPLSDRSNADSTVPSRLSVFPVPRRFMVEHDKGRTFLVFGFGSESNLKVKSVADPSDIALKQTAKNYVSDNVFDPVKLLSTDKFGVSPQNTTLNITYRSNTTDNSNAAVNSISSISSAEIVFEGESSLDSTKVDFIRSSATVKNLEPINGTLSFSTTQEISQMLKASLGTQGRAVTLQDYVASAYAMPSKFGSVKRAAIVRDTNDLKRNLNMYVVSQDTKGDLQQASTSLKNNLKNWLNSVRMVTDTIDIFDTKIINLGLEIDVVVNQKSNFTTAMSEIREKLFDELNLSRPEIGQSFSVGEVEKILSTIPSVVRFNSVKIVSKSGTGYSDIRYDITSNVSPDGGLIYIPEDSIWELKNATDITGKVQ
jgi:hypothetical protein